jgi:hypothetical protein
MKIGLHKRVQRSALAVKRKVKRFVGSNGVEFEDGTKQNVSVVIYATGKEIIFSFGFR